MKKTMIYLSLIVIVLLLSSCSSKTSATTIEPTSVAGAYLSTDYPDAANLRSQLAYGILKLADSSKPITPKQAQSLIPLWQGIIALSGDSTTTNEELTAVQDQIVMTLSAEQLNAIAEMHISNTELTQFYAEYGVVLPTPIPGMTKVPGSGSPKTEEEKAAAQATAQALGKTTGSGQAAKTLLFDKVIEYLQGILK